MLALFLHKAMFGAKGSRSRKTASEPLQSAVGPYASSTSPLRPRLAKTLSKVGASTVALELQEALVNVSWAEAQ